MAIETDDPGSESPTGQVGRVHGVSPDSHPRTAVVHGPSLSMRVTDWWGGQRRREGLLPAGVGRVGRDALQLLQRRYRRCPGRTQTGPATTVVDFGTGTRFVAAGLAGRTARVLGVDHSAAMLAVARGNLAAPDATNVVTVEGDLDALPLPNDGADVAVANMVLHHAPDPAGHGGPSA
jgi:SAM-dependent methyltransferase